MQIAIAPRDEDIGGAIVGMRGGGFIKARRYAHHHVADAALSVFLKNASRCGNQK